MLGTESGKDPNSWQDAPVGGNPQNAEYAITDILQDLISVDILWITTYASVLPTVWIPTRLGVQHVP
jgi:hypothetical protein